MGLQQGCKNTAVLHDQRVYVCNQKVYVHNQKSLHAPNEEIPQQYEDQSQRVLQVDLKKKGYGRLITAATLVLSLSFDKFGHVLEVNFLKKRSSLVVHFVNETFASGKSLELVGEKHQQLSGNTGLCMWV